VLNRCAKYTIDVSGAVQALPAIIAETTSYEQWQDGDWMDASANRCKVLWRYNQEQDNTIGTFKIPPPDCQDGKIDKIYIVDGQNHHTEVRPIVLNIAPCYPNTSFKLPMSNKCGRVGV